MKYIAFDNLGSLAGRYDSDIHLPEQIPEDAIEASDELFFRTINEQDGTWQLIEGEIIKVPFPEPTPEELFNTVTKLFEAAVQKELDDDAIAKGYDNIISACSYAGAPNPFQTEAKAFIARRGNAWAYCYSELVKIKNGTREMPTIEQIISELPARISAE